MSRSFSIEANNSGETRSSASRLKIQSWLAASTANCFCAAKPGHELMITRAPQAAAVIHKDFERGFIACETIAYDDYVACKGEVGAKDAGKMRVEGKDYVVRDGDVLLFRFNV